MTHMSDRAGGPDLAETPGQPGRAGPPERATGTATAPAPTGYTAPEPPPEPSLWVGWIIFASMMMIMLGTFHAVEGLVALFRDELFLVGKNGLTVKVDYTTWGWTHLVFGAVMVLVGVCVLFGQMWARVVGVGLAMLSALVNISFLNAYPLWSVLMIALDIVVIWALSVHGGEMKAARRR